MGNGERIGDLRFEKGRRWNGMGEGRCGQEENKTAKNSKNSGKKASALHAPQADAGNRF